MSCLPSFSQSTPIDSVLSPDGRWNARAYVDPSTDWLTWAILPTKTMAQENPTVEKVHHTYPSGIAWAADGSGFFYDRLLPFAGGHGLYFHRIGTEQRQDRCVFYRAEHPDWFYQPHVSPDGLWLTVAILNGSAANRLSIFPLDAPGDVDAAHEITLIDQFTGRYDVVHWQADRLVLRAVTADTPNGCLLAVDLPSVDLPGGAQTVLLPQGDLPLVDAAPLADGWVGSHLHHGRAELIHYDVHGAPTGTIPLPGLGTVDWLESAQVHPRNFAIRNSQSSLHFTYTDFVRPPQIYRWQIGDERPQPVDDAGVYTCDPADFVTRVDTVISTDGVVVPIFLFHRRDLLLDNCPTMFTAYGGLGHALTPRFAEDTLAWVKMGGVFVSVCARGGGELGTSWHQAAVSAHKQRTFDDVLSAARRLVDLGITSPSRLGLWGVSNGGLTAGACLTQAPGLFGAVVIESGLLDMLRYPQLGQGRQWLLEYGNPDDPAQRATLASYSPLHNIQPGQPYPSTLIVTHEHDPRVGAEHSLTFARALAEAQAGDAPIRLRVHAGSGHGPPQNGDERSRWINERLSFLAHHLGMGE